VDAHPLAMRALAASSKVMPSRLRAGADALGLRTAISSAEPAELAAWSEGERA
jgi:hypothetical protein